MTRRVMSWTFIFLQNIEGTCLFVLAINVGTFIIMFRKVPTLIRDISK